MARDSAGDGSAFDGRPTCALCHDDDVSSAHEWCEISRSLVCERCCEGVSGFDPGRLMTAFANSETVLSPSEVADVCAACPHRPNSHGLGEDESLKPC
jgi:hypothetical protein